MSLMPVCGRHLEVLEAGPMNVRTLRAKIKVRSELVTAGLNALASAGLVKMEDGPERARVYSPVSR